MTAGPIAGYSGKTLAAKLGVREDTRMWVFNPPPQYRSLIGELPAGAAMETSPSDADILHAFVTDRKMLATNAVQFTDAPRAGAALWISWPKKTSPLFVDLTEGGVRELILPTGWVDVKVCAVDPDWSGLKFFRRRR